MKFEDIIASSFKSTNYIGHIDKQVDKIEKKIFYWFPTMEHFAGVKIIESVTEK